MKGKKIRYSPNDYIATASGVQETELNAQTNIVQPCVKSRSRSVTVDESSHGHHGGYVYAFFIMLPEEFRGSI